MTLAETLIVGLLFLILVMQGLTALYHKRIYVVHVAIAEALHARDSELSEDLRIIKRAVLRGRRFEGI